MIKIVLTLLQPSYWNFHCLNFINPDLRNIYYSLIQTDTMKSIDNFRQQKKDQLKFDEDINTMIDNIMNKLEHSTNTDRLYSIIDELKHNEQNKRSLNYQLLNVWLKSCKFFLLLLVRYLYIYPSLFFFYKCQKFLFLEEYPKQFFKFP